jgi:3',5'-cyclic AMP phosphodiesterase CpdA
VLGNHDVGRLTKEEFLELCGAGRPSRYSFDVRGVHFVVLDGNCHADGSDFRAGGFSWDDAWVSAAQIEWLARDLEAADDRRAVVLCHENIDHRLWNGALDPHVVRDAARVRQVLETAGNVAAVVQAHYHPGLRTVQNGIPYICLRAMVVGPGPVNNAYAIIEVREDGRLAVTGGGQQRGYGLEGD